MNTKPRSNNKGLIIKVIKNYLLQHLDGQAFTAGLASRQITSILHTPLYSQSYMLPAPEQGIHRGSGLI